MKYLPLVWAAWWRKPTEFLLLLAAVTCAFALFGLMIGLQQTTQKIVAESRMDRIIVNPRYQAPLGLPLALRESIAKVAGVTAVGFRTYLAGYVGEPRNRIWIDAVDEDMRAAAPETPLSPAQWDRLIATPYGVYVSRRIATRLGLQRGSRFSVIATNARRADGAAAWEFEVLDVIANEPGRQGDLVLGNYHYVDNLRIESARSRGYFIVAAEDPHIGSRVAGEIDRVFANSGTTTASITFQMAQQNLTADALGIALMTWGISAAGLFMILLLLGNAIGQSVRERVPEFAVLKAVGFHDRTIAALVISESLLPCVVGALAGLVLANGLAALPRSWLPSLYASQPPPSLTAAVWSSALAFAALLSVLSTLLPIVNLRRMNVAASLAPT